MKLWLRKGGRDVGGRERMGLLRAIQEEGSLSRAARKLGMSYRHAWGVVRELERELGFKILRAERGGEGGGKSSLTEKGKALVREYELMERALRELVREGTFWQDLSTRLSARNRLRGTVENVQLGEVEALVKISAGPSTLTALITREAAEALGLKKGDRVEAIIKATEVMVVKP